VLSLRSLKRQFIANLVFSLSHIQAIECSAGCNPENGYCEKPEECRCKPGWQGVTCKQCMPFPGCLHGSCEKAWQCICEEGWMGSQCDQDTNQCSSKPCTDNSTCIQTGQGGYLCICLPGYTGESCHLKKGSCLTNGSPCQNGGTCSDAGGLAAYPSCACPLGFAGDFCEIDTDSCDPNPCLNGGNCTDYGPAIIQLLRITSSGCYSTLDIHPILCLISIILKHQLIKLYNSASVFTNINVTASSCFEQKSIQFLVRFHTTTQSSTPAVCLRAK
uniref:Delta like non-canonical Notch ligand 1 n=1 Tax=Oncorhynchus mykiss TaxID=8022 RepID=A0A8C7PJN3_ONCMY